MVNNQPVYDSSIFEQSSIDAAKEIILTPENGVSTQTRWDEETPWLINLIGKHIKPGDLVIDYGCGVGRIAMPLVNGGCPVIGVDTSSSMRSHATNLIANERFVAMTPNMLDQLIHIGVKADCVLAIWFLQHCFELEDVVERIYRVLNKGGVVGVADMHHRAIPTNQGWRSDGKDVRSLLTRYFSLIQQYPYNLKDAPPNLRKNAYVAFFQKNK